MRKGGRGETVNSHNRNEIVQAESSTMRSNSLNKD
jgi:hypothetical protein